MSIAQRRTAAAAGSSDHEHVGRISTQSTIFVLIIVVLLVYEIRWVLVPFVIAAVVAFICTPLVDWLTALTRWPRWLFACIIFFVLLMLGATLGYLGIPPLIREATHLVGDLQGTIQRIAQGIVGAGKIAVFGPSMDATQLAQAAVDSIRDESGQGQALTFAGGVAAATLFGTILALVLLCYFLLDGARIAAGLLWLVPPNQRPLIHHIWSFIDPVLKRYFVGVLIVVGYTAIAAYIGLGFFLGIPHAVFLALFTGVLEMIPMLGPAASAAVAGVVAIHYAKGFGPIIAYAIYATALRISIDQVFGPLALGTAARVHPVLVIFCFLTGGVLFGLIGVILAVPVALVIKVTLARLYDEPLRSL